MTYVQSIILGIVQGLTEFIPVSSSAHLILLPKLVGWQLQDIIFDVVLHLGSALALLYYFRADWMDLLNSLFKDFKKIREHAMTDPKSVPPSFSSKSKFLITIVLVNIPVGIAGLVFKDTIEMTFRAPPYIAIQLILVSLVMFGSNRLANVNSNNQTTYIGFSKSLLIALSQIIAFVPGTSRSGITMSVGLLLNISRDYVAKFSFMLVTPLILAGVLVKLPDLVVMSTGELSQMLVGMIISGITSFYAIKFVLRILKKVGLMPFVIYRVALGVIILSVAYIGV